MAQVVGVQLDIAWEDREENFRTVRTLLEKSPISPGSLIILPEMFSSGFSMNVSQIHEGEERKTAQFLAGLARDLESTVLGGLVTCAADGRGRNEAVVFQPDGEERVRYQKIHPFRYGGETDHYEPGQEIHTFAWAGFTVAPFICYDLRFPEVFRIGAHRGANLCVIIANWPEAREDHWLTLLKARAIENQAYVIGVNRSGKDPRLAYSGRSQVIGPTGTVLVDAGSEEGVFTGELDREALLEYRSQFPALQDLRPELIGQGA